MHNRSELQAYYAENSMLMLNYKYSLADLENMFAFERMIYMTYAKKHIEEKSNLINQTAH